MTMTMTRDQVQEREAARTIARRIRSSRTELLGLPMCPICEGATEGATDPEVVCVCASQRAELEARLAKLRGEHGSQRGNSSDVIAP